MSSLRLDTYVIDTLMRDLLSHDKQPSAFVVFLHLWRRTIGEDRPSVHQSHQQIADATGLSKTAVQNAIKTLLRRRLLKVKRSSRTATPEYTVCRPWTD